MSAKKILLVDDDEETVGYIEKKLQNKGCLVIKAFTGQQAIELARVQQPHVILMDIMLPDIDGSETVRLLNDDDLTRAIPVLFLSGIVAGEGHSQQSEIRVGNRNYPAIGKPFTFYELYQKIGSILALMGTP